MTDLIQLQADLAEFVRGIESLANVGVVDYRKLVLQSEVDYTTVWMSGRNGRNGAGILVMRPEATCDKPNVEGPLLDFDCDFVIVSVPEINDVEGGTALNASIIAQYIVDALHLETIDPYGQFRAAPKPITPDDTFKGPVDCMRAKLRVMCPREQTQRVGYCSASIADNLCTLTCATAGASIVYTTDGTFPRLSTDQNYPSTAQLYSTPFAAPIGTVIRFAGYKSGYNSSKIFRTIAP